MEWLNYHHLLYFWTVAREGGLVPAARRLHVSHPTVLAQVRALEERLGEKLFDKSGRKLVLTDMGRIVYRYAEEIFSLGQELLSTVAGRTTGQPRRLRVGVVDVVPKLLVSRLLQPVFALSEPVHLSCHESDLERLLGALALHTLDVVIADTPVPQGSNVRAYAHLLGETEVTLFSSRSLAQAHARDLPSSLDGAPFLLPLPGSAARRGLDAWFHRQGIKPRIVAEFQDSGLMQAFAEDGRGLFFAPSALARDICAAHGVDVLLQLPDVKERVWALSAERRLAHPALLAIQAAAREALVPSPPRSERPGA